MLGDAEAGHEVVRDGNGVCEFGLADDFFCSRLVEEEEVDNRGPPGGHTVRAAEACVADERVSAAVVVACVAVDAEVVLLECKS